MYSANGQLGCIAEKLAAARIEDTKGVSTSGHRFQLHPPLTQRDLTALEARFGIFLPEDYREFLLVLGDGGAGPYCGMLRLLESLELADEAATAARLQAECPLSYPRPGEEPLPWTFDDIRCGSILICQQGDSWQARLAILGEARGRIAYVITDDSAPAYFVRDLTFLDWYERWLDDLLADELDTAFGFDNPDEDRSAKCKPLTCDPLPTIPPGPFQQQLERVRNRLWEGEDPTASTSYSPPAAASELQAFEGKYGIAIPPDYRAFLESVQTGGPGPYYGLLPFRYAAPAEGQAARLNRPFPFTPQSVALQGCPGITLAPGETRPDGTLTIAHLGLGRYAFLVVQGEASGCVFYLDTERRGCLPYFVTDAGFLDWYERWQLEGRGDRWFGFDNEAYSDSIIRDVKQSRIGWEALPPKP